MPIIYVNKPETKMKAHLETNETERKNFFQNLRYNFYVMLPLNYILYRKDLKK